MTLAAYAGYMLRHVRAVAGVRAGAGDKAARVDAALAFSVALLAVL
jgi:hypothetical protein